MENFSEDQLYGICGNGSYQAVVAYLEGCAGGEEYLVKYQRVFEGDAYVLETDDERIKDVLRTYEDYLKHILKTKMTPRDYRKYIVECFRDFFPTVRSYAKFAKAFPAYFKELGYFAQFGVTAPFPTLYLWKTQNKSELDVELPEATVKMNVYEMDDVITNCWYNYLTFGKVGTGGWVSDDGAYYFKGKYDLDSDDFQISLLKHEGQHFYDKQLNYAMPSVELEYRAKLVELIYYKDEKCLNSFLDRMSDDPKNPHGYANKRVVSNLSKLIWGEELVIDKEKWHDEYEKVSKMALKLLKEDTATSKWLRKKVLIWRGKLRKKLVTWWQKR